jgi:glyoxylase-like metal-dependent hydrolase (beta-lactamase superfamily II)
MTSSVILSASTSSRSHYFTGWTAQPSASVSPGQFDIQKVTTDVYFAQARPWALANSNAAILVNSSDVLVVDAHSHPAAAAALIAQIRGEVTPKLVRWLVNTHFHWDHTQGSRAYLAPGPRVDILASNTTKQLMSQLLVPRLRAALDPASRGPRGSQQVARQLEDLRLLMGKKTSETEKGALHERIAQLESFAREMKDFEPTLPTITFEESYMIREKDHELHLQFHGLGHTAGDVVVFCPQRRVIVTGDLHHPRFPGFIDSYPQLWPKTIDSIATLEFDHILPGHGPMEHDSRGLIGRRNFIEEMTERVIAGKRAGQSVADLQRTITAVSLTSLRSGDFAPADTPEAVDAGLKESIDNMYERVEKIAYTGSEPVRLRG